MGAMGLVEQSKWKDVTLPHPNFQVDLADFCAALDSRVRMLPPPSTSLDEEVEDGYGNGNPDREMEALRREGDELFSVQDFIGAIRLYSQCVARRPQTPATFEDAEASRRFLVVTYASRSETWLWLQKFEKALSDALQALELDPYHVMGLFCKGRALHGLDRYQEACLALSAASQQNPADEAIREALAKSVTGYNQSHHGDYKLEEFLLSGCQGLAPACSDYVGPVEICYVGSTGRGLVTTEDVVAGQLLLVSNALSVACSPTEFWSETRITKANHDFLITELSHEVQNSNRRMAQLCTLAGDSDEAMEIPEMEIFMPEIDWTHREHRDVSLMDDERLSGIVRMNAFDAIKCIDPIPFGDIETESNTGSGAGIASSGIWVLPSFINHCCASNCNMMFVGNAMFIRASRDVAAGEELTLNFCDPFEPEEYRKDSLKWWKFTCKCERCVMERALGGDDTKDSDEEESQKREGTITTTTPWLSSLPKVFLFFGNLWPTEHPITRIFTEHRKLVDNGQLQELSRIIGAVEKLIQKSAAHMEPRVQDWIRAPFIEAYTARIILCKDDLAEKVAALTRVLDIMLAVSGGDLSAMQMSSTLLRDAGQLYGEDSDEYHKIEKFVIDIFTTTLGEHSKKFFVNLINARFHSVNQAFG